MITNKINKMKVTRICEAVADTNNDFMSFVNLGVWHEGFNTTVNVYANWKEQYAQEMD